jgi:hypothetical protein
MGGVRAFHQGCRRPLGQVEARRPDSVCRPKLMIGAVDLAKGSIAPTSVHFTSVVGTFETSGDVRYLVTIWSLSGGKRTSRWQSISVAIDPEV